MSLLFLKFATAVLLLVIGLVGGLLPFAFNQKTEDDRTSHGNTNSMVNAFAGGVLLSAALVHMLPDASEACKELGIRLVMQVNPNSGGVFPIASCVAGVAFLFLALIEAAAMLVLSARHARVTLVETESFEPLLPLGRPRSNSEPTLTSPKHSCCTARKLKSAGSDMMVSSLAATSANPATAMALVMALVVHSVLEGIGIGAQKSTQTIATVGLAVVAHKGMALFALGSQLQRYKSKRVVVAMIFLVAICSPAGIVIGTLVLSHVDKVGSGLVLALASGTFLFVAVPELLIPAFGDGNNHKKRVTVVLIAVLGFVLMSFLAFWA